MRAAAGGRLAVLALVLASCGGSPAKEGPAAAPVTATSVARPVRLRAAMASWTLPRPLSREAAGVVGGRIVVAGGLTSGDRTVSDVSALDATTGRSESLPPLREHAHDAGSTVLGGRLLVVGGGATSVSDVVQSASPHPAVVGHLPTPRADLAVATIGGNAYVIGGYDGHQARSDVLVTSDGKTFRPLGRLREPVRYPAVAAVGGQIVVIGGETPAGVDSTAVQVYDPRAGTTRVVGRLAVGRSHASAIVLGGQLWVLGGRVRGGSSDAIVAVDPANGSTVDAGRLPRPVRDAAVVTIGGAAYLLGGQHPLPVTDVVSLRITTG